MASTPNQSNSPPTHRRSVRQARTEAILYATLEELVRTGYGALSYESISERAGVAKTTVYRRYPSKTDLVCAAVRHHFSEALHEQPDTGSLRGDLIALGRETVRYGSSVLGQSMVRIAMLHALEPALGEVADDLKPKLQIMHKPIAERAIERGELMSEDDYRRVIATLISTLLFRVVVRREGIDELEIGALVDMFLYGVCRSSPSRSNPSRAAR